FGRPVLRAAARPALPQGQRGLARRAQQDGQRPLAADGADHRRGDRPVPDRRATIPAQGAVIDGVPAALQAAMDLWRRYLGVPPSDVYWTSVDYRAGMGYTFREARPLDALTPIRRIDPCRDRSTPSACTQPAG